MRTRHFAALAGLLVLGACNFDILNTNQPTLGDLLTNPTRGKLQAAATGVFAGARTGIQSLIWRLGSMGREGINLLGNNQPDYVEPFFGPVQAGGSFGGTNWVGYYAHIRSANVYLRAVEKIATCAGATNETCLTAEEKAASRGMARTLKALSFMYVIEQRAQLGAPVDVDRDVSEAPAPWVSEDGVWSYIVALLDSAQNDLVAAGSTAFPFSMPPGLSDFGDPGSYIAFNRALAAKANVLRATVQGGCGGNAGTCYTNALTALSASFISAAPADFQSGAYFDFSHASGDLTNDLSEPLDGLNWFALTDALGDAELQGNGRMDLRALQKIDTATVTQILGGIPIPGKLKFTIYMNCQLDSLGASGCNADDSHGIAIIRNEELVLLRAEAEWFTGAQAAALADLNIVRQNAGGLPPTTVTAADPNAAFIAALLYERRYSLLWEQGTRWIDARRFNLLSTIPADVPAGNVPEVMPVPQPECDARNLPTKAFTPDVTSCTPLTP
jgi:starch-binding outer membrane protein, SusD/RagB family